MHEKTLRGKMPFILKFAEKQKDVPKRLQMFYDEKEKLTMVRTKNGVTPLVRFKNPITELLTKTAEIKETDDYNVSYSEMYTKTKVLREGEDLNNEVELS